MEKIDTTNQSEQKSRGPTAPKPPAEVYAEGGGSGADGNSLYQERKKGIRHDVNVLDNEVMKKTRGLGN